MKILKSLIYLFQFAYYWQIVWDKYTWQGLLPARVSKGKAVVILCAIEMLLMLSLYIIASRLLGFGIHKIHSPVLVMGILAVALVFFNDWLVGPEKRTEHYRIIFDGWDKQKRRRWTFYVIFIGISTFAFFMFVVESSRPMLQS